MKRKLLTITVFSMLTLAACGTSVEQFNNDGNEAYNDRNYEGALAAYQQAQSRSPELAIPHYNAANVHYRTQGYDQAQLELEQTLVKDNSGNLTQNGFYNLGNTFFRSQQFEQAIDAYKEVLRLNPDDLEAKYNLELALQQLQQQQEQDQQQDQQQDDQQNDQQQDQQQDDQQNDQQQDQQQDDQQDDQQQDQQQDDQQNDQQQDQQQDDQQNDQQQDQQQDDQQNDQQQDDQQDDQQQDQQQDGQQDDQQQDGQQGGQSEQEQNDAQIAGQPQIVEGLTKEQARQLFEAATQDTKSLEEYLQQVLVVPGEKSAQDW
jgi:Ca-activated chloride channel family protein